MPDFEQDMQIDELQLDQEWLNQAPLYQSYARMASEARGATDRAKIDLDVATAELEHNIRNHPEKYKIPKITESAIQAAILMDDLIQKKMLELNTLRTEQSLLEKTLTALDHRKKALENLVFLYGQSYFAGPKEPRDMASREFVKEKKRREARRKALSNTNLNKQGEESE